MSRKEKLAEMMNEFLTSILSKSIEDIKQFTANNWDTKKLQERGSDDLARVLFHLNQSIGKAEIKEVIIEKESKVSAILVNETTEDWFKCSLMVSEEEPLKIKSVSYRPTSPPLDESLETTEENIAEQIEKIISKIIDKELFSGIILLAKGSKIIYHSIHGYANIPFAVPPNLDTKFNLGSMNKMFTSLGIAELVQEGKLSFSDKLIDIIPETKIDQADKITIHHLLTHTSGLGNFFTPEYMRNKEKYKEIKDIIELVEKDKLATEPGEMFRYSNSGFEVLGHIIEQISGISYYEFLKKNIFLPIGMKGTDSYSIDGLVPNLAEGYTRTSMGGASSNTLKSNIKLARNRGSAAGGGYSTAKDLHIFSQALFTFKILDENLTKTLLEGKIQLEPGNNDIKYAYGFGSHKIGNLVRYGHNGGAPGINAFFGVYQPINFTLIILSNYDPPSSERIANRIESLIANLKYSL